MSEIKTCIICGKEFYGKRKDSKCCSDKCKQEYKKLKYNNDENKRNKNKERCKHWRETHKEQRKSYSKKYYQENKEIVAERFKKWVEKNKEYRKEYTKRRTQERYKTDIDFKTKIWCRKQLLRCISNTQFKNKHSFEILGYTPNQLKQRLESQFKSDMDWSNHGTLWQIDHKKPLSLFKFELSNGEIDYHQVFLANCLANLQPMYTTENLSKGNKFNI